MVVVGINGKGGGGGNGKDRLKAITCASCRSPSCGRQELLWIYIRVKYPIAHGRQSKAPEIATSSQDAV